MVGKSFSCSYKVEVFGELQCVLWVVFFGEVGLISADGALEH
jgi:hypothetical protein